MNANKPMAYSYLRYSTRIQELGNSFERQLNAAKAYCDRNSLTLSEQNYEDLGRSAYRNKRRPALDEMLKHIKSGVIPRGSHILLESTDRLSRRGFKHALDLLHEIVGLGCVIAVIDKSEVFTKDNIDQFNHALGFMLEADRSHQESVRKSNLIRAAKGQIRKDKKIKGRTPFWIDVKGDEVVFNEHVETIKRIIELRVQGYSSQRIAATMNKEGYKTKSGRAITASTVLTNYRNRAVYGAKEWFETQPDGSLKSIEITSGLFPPICDRATYERINEKKHATQTTSTRTSKYSGLMKCSACGSALTVRNVKRSKDGSVYKYRRCIGSLEGRCDVKSNFKSVDEVLDRALRDMVYRRSTSIDDKVPEQQNAVKELELRISDLSEATKHVRNPVALGMLYDDIQNEKDKLTEAREVLRLLESVPSVDTCEYASLLDSGLTNQEINEQLKQTIEKIELRNSVTASGKPTCRNTIYKIIFVDGNKRTFIASHAAQGGKFELNLFSDTKKLRDYVRENSTDE
ncbi:recombinase family protein [Vibrio fluvialis]|nr:recombinase family protein [Vibrio fluvialis]